MQSTLSCARKNNVVINSESQQFQISGLPANTWVGSRNFELMQSTECKGAKLYEIRSIVDIDQCKTSCLEYNCNAVNLFQIAEMDFMCEILGEVDSYEPAQGAACYVVNT
uniref:Apple domain-containing protein n=1 Tax=Rhabditophanes sp. KR3021 TaxID=114890 RepID=A0AC35THZ4_9BILA